MMEDGEGREIDFKNTIILLTSNVGTDLIVNMCKDPELLPTPEGVATALKDALLKVFPAALLGRLVVMPYYPISDAVMRLIIRLQLNRIVKRVRENHNVELAYGEELVDLVAQRCTDVQSGARAVDAILTRTLLPEISTEFLKRLMNNVPIAKVTIGVADSAFAYKFE